MFTRHGEWITREASKAANPSELTWQKPTGEESSTRHGEQTYSGGELRQNRPFECI